MRKKTFLKFTLFVSMVFPVFSVAIAGPGSALDHVQEMLHAVMTVQTDPDLQGPESRSERRTEIRKIIAANFNTAQMAQETLGPTWEKLKKAEQAEFTGIFEDLFQDSYSRLVLDFLGQEKIAYKEPEINGDRAEVFTTILRPNEEIPVDYSLMIVDKQWFVSDVKIDGVSIVKKYKRSFARVIQTESYAALLEKMRLQQKAIHKDS